jgi:hypothetical protein
MVQDSTDKAGLGMDEFISAGLVPASLLRWEVTRRDRALELPSSHPRTDLGYGSAPDALPLREMTPDLMAGTDFSKLGLRVLLSAD